MLKFGEEEVRAVGRVAEGGQMFRYFPGGQCERFEKRYAKSLGAKHVALTASGTNALTAALVGVGIGPGDEVIVPSFTYMASAIAVLAAGAIPVIVDVDESTLIDPDAIDDAVGPCTRAVMPVHLWGQSCDMRSVMRVARKHKLIVVEDVCQAVGGGYEGKMLGTIGHAAGFSFNYYKNMTCGEGGAVVTNKDGVARRARCMIDSCSFYWKGRNKSFTPFVSNGARASEFQGAILNEQLTRLPALIRKLRSAKKQILRATAKSGLTPTPVHSLDYECGTFVMYLLPTPEQAGAFCKSVGCGIAGQTGRHVYTEWDPILELQGASHPALNPFDLPQNKKCRKNYSKDMLPRSLDVLNRTAMIALSPDMTPQDVKSLVTRINDAAANVLQDEGKPPARKRRTRKKS